MKCIRQKCSIPYHFLKLLSTVVLNCPHYSTITQLKGLSQWLTTSNRFSTISLRFKFMVFASPAMTATERVKAALMLISQFEVSFLFLLYIICQLHVQKLHGSQGLWVIYLSCIHTDKLCALPQWTFPLEHSGKNEVGLSNGAIAHTTVLSEGRMEEWSAAFVCTLPESPLEAMPASGASTPPAPAPLVLPPLLSICYRCKWIARYKNLH